MFVVLAVFIAGSLVGTAHTQWWTALPGVGADVAGDCVWSVDGAGGEPRGIRRLRWHDGRRRTAASRPPRRAARRARTCGCAGHGRWWRARSAWRSVNIATLLIAGRPWGVTSAFALWGAKVAGGIRHRRGNVAILDGAGASRGAQGQRADRRHLGDELRHHPRRAAGGAAGRPLRARLEGARPGRWPPPSLAACCSVTARASRTAATSARTSAALRRAACTGGSGCPRLSPATSLGTLLRPLFGLSVERTSSSC